MVRSFLCCDTVFYSEIVLMDHFQARRSSLTAIAGTTKCGRNFVTFFFFFFPSTFRFSVHFVTNWYWVSSALADVTGYTRTCTYFSLHYNCHVLCYIGSSCDQDSLSYNSRYVTDTDSGLGRATPPHRTSSPAPCNSSPSGPGSLPPSHHSRRLRYDDTASESGGSEYSGLR